MGLNAQNAANGPLVTCLILAVLKTELDNKPVTKRRWMLMAGSAVLLLLFARPQIAQTAKAPPPPEARVDLNHATFEELLTVPGITPSWAGRIIRFRPYRAKSDLMERGIVTNEVYVRIKDYIIAHREKE